MTKLQELLNECENLTGRDFEGDDTYRIHVETAKQLIKDAYELGKSEAEE